VGFFYFLLFFVVFWELILNLISYFRSLSTNLQAILRSLQPTVEGSEGGRVELTLKVGWEREGTAERKAERESSGEAA